MEGEWSVLSKGNVEMVIWADQAVVFFCTNSFTAHLMGSLVRQVARKDLPNSQKSDKGDVWVRFQVPYVAQAYNQGQF